jgi:hypothetical protein
MPRTIDLDAARAARSENEPVIVRFGGHDFALPAELPLDAAIHAAEPAKFLEVLFGAEHDAFMAQRPSMQDVVALAEGVASAYGFESVGESPASPT